MTKAPKTSATTIVAKIDAGFGNNLYLRGEGTGLSWDAGVLMTNTGADEWTFVINHATEAVDFKLLINDLTWSTGPNYTVLPGTLLIVSPEFA